MRLLFNVASALAAFVVAWLWWRASQPPPRPEVRWQHRPRLRGVGAFLGTSQSAGRAMHWSSCSPAGCRKRPHSANAEAAACPRNVPRHFEEP